MDDYEYITDYKGYAIYQDMENGYFYAHDSNYKIVAYEATRKMVKSTIDHLK